MEPIHPEYIKARSLRYIHLGRIPLLFILFFIAEQAVFNYWIGLTPNPYIVEFTSITFGLGVLLFGPTILFSRRVRYSYLFAANSVVALILTSQYIYYSYAKGFLQASALAYAGQAIDEQATIMTLLSPRLIFFLVPLLAVVLLYFLSQKGDTKEEILTHKERFAGVTFVVLLGVGGYGVFLSHEAFHWQKIVHPYVTLRDMNNFVFAPNDLVKKVGIVNYYIRDGIGFAFRHVALSSEDIQFTRDWFDNKAQPRAVHYRGIASGRNLIFLQVESLEHAVIREKMNGKEITPRLNALANEGLYFRNYYTQVGPGNTADAEFVTLNSLYPLSNTVAFIDYAHNTYTALPQLLKKNGYHTYVLHDDEPSFWNRSNIYPALGYDEIKSKKDFIPEGEPIFDHLGDVEFLAQSLSMMRTFTSPFMATAITLSSHTPFVIPTNLQTLSFSDDNTLTETQKNYLQSINYTDRAIGEFIDGLKAADLYDNSLIVIYGDHGSFSDISAKVGTSTNTAIEDLRTNQVPLLILAPGTGLRKTLDIPGSHLDLYPTIANLLGIPAPEHLIGQDLLNTKTPILTHRDPDSQVVNTILSTELVYEVGSDGVFEHGTCLALPEMHPLPISDCGTLYNAELAATRASDFIVKGNLLPVISRVQNNAGADTPKHK